jgi:hypothetical protein
MPAAATVNIFPTASLASVLALLLLLLLEGISPTNLFKRLKRAELSLSFVWVQ